MENANLNKKFILDKISTLCHTKVLSTNAQLFAQAGEQSANDANRLLNIRPGFVRISTPFKFIVIRMMVISRPRLNSTRSKPTSAHSKKNG
jgi:hypothetical protein